MQPETSLAERVARLSDGQRECLRLVRQAMKSEQIAGELGISKSAVDKRIEAAMRQLGVSRRDIAAMLLERVEGGYEPVVYDPIPIADAASMPQPSDPEVPSGGRDDDASGRIVGLGPRQRIEWMLIVALGVLLVFGVATVAATLFQGAVVNPRSAPTPD